MRAGVIDRRLVCGLHEAGEPARQAVNNPGSYNRSDSFDILAGKAA